MEKNRTILVSACLLGVNCRYNGKTKPCEKILKLVKNDILIPVCPEQLGGLKTPRPPALFLNENTLINTENIDVTDNFNRGAEEVLKICKLYGIKKAILKERSPSCGKNYIYYLEKGKEVLKNGSGLTARLLLKNNIEIISEEEL